MEITKDDVRNLEAIRERIRTTYRVVQRKRKLRDSERAMWCSDLTAQALTCSKLIAHGSFSHWKGGAHGNG